MIRLYAKDEWYAAASKEDIITDVEAYFDLYGEIPDTKEVRFILKQIEQAEYVNGTRFRDRFGGELYYSELSTGSKCAILAHLEKDKVIDFAEAGSNVYQAVILLNMDCTILVEEISWLMLAYFEEDCKLPEEVDIDVIGNKVYHNIRDYEKEV